MFATCDLRCRQHDRAGGHTHHRFAGALSMVGRYLYLTNAQRWQSTRKIMKFAPASTLIEHHTPVGFTANHVMIFPQFHSLYEFLRIGSPIRNI